MPPPTLYHRWLPCRPTVAPRWVGWHATAMRRAAAVLAAGLIAALVLSLVVDWGLALVGGWDAAAVAFLLATWPIIIRADGAKVAHLAAREDQNEGTARALLVGASVARLLGAGSARHPAGQDTGGQRVPLISVAVLTVVLSWALINTVYTLRYAHEHFGSARGGIEFGDGDGKEPPSYRDFAYVSFTIGMCYQVSD